MSNIIFSSTQLMKYGFSKKANDKNEKEFDINANPRIFFLKSELNDTDLLIKYLSSPKHPKMIYLLNPSYEFDVFKFIERQFTITTNKGSYLFNIDFLKDTISTIKEFIKENPNHFQYHLNIKDEENVMQKVEQLYLGAKVKFSDDELYLLKMISKELDISRTFQTMRSFSFNSDKEIVDEYQINLSSFHSYLRKSLPRTFSIITKNKEYQCNMIGIRSSKIIDELLSKDPTLQQYNYDFDDEFGEFQHICDLFNFNFVKINTDNMNAMKMIAEDLQIEFVLSDINNFIDDYEKRVQTIDDQQSIMDSIDDLFEMLFNIKQISVESVKQKIMESDWIKTEENIQELAAFILQAIKTDFILHPYLADLIELLDKEGNLFEKLKILVPFIVKQLMSMFGQDKLTCSFIFLLQQKGIIKKDEIMNTLIKLEAKFRSNKEEKKQEKYTFDYKKNMIFDNFLIFLPELFEIFNSNFDRLLSTFSSRFHNFIKLYFPNKIEDFKKMRESGEPIDQITKALRNDDVDTLQSIVTQNHVDLTNTLVPFNIFEDFVPNGQTNYIDYSAAYGSLRCFKYLLLNHVKVTTNSFNLAVFGGNIEIVKIIDQKLAEPNNDKPNFKKFSFGELKYISKSTYGSIGLRVDGKNSIDKIISTIKKHQNDLFDWIFEQKFENAIQDNNLIQLIILAASENGDSHSIASIVDKGFDFCSFDKDICAVIIHNAAKNGFYKFLKFLSMVMSKALNQYEKQINYIFDTNSSVFFGNLSIFKFCFEKAKSMNLERAISISIDKDNIKMVKYIFENYMNSTTNNKIDLNDLLINSIKLKTSDIFDYLLDQIKKIKSTKDIYLQKIDWLTAACKYKKIEISKKITEYILEEKENDRSEPDFSLPFYNAAHFGSTELCQYFIDKKLFIDFELISLQYKDLNCINKEILDIITKHIPPESNEIFKEIYLTDAIRTKNKSLIEYILNQGALCDDDILFEAVRTCDIDIVNMILNKNSKPSFINQISNSGTALNLAVSLNNLEIVKRLLSIPGIDPSLYEQNNNTPLITAIINLNIGMINLLLDFYGPNLKSQSWQLNVATRKFLNILSRNKKEKNNSNIMKVLNRLLETDLIDLNCHDCKYSLLSCACKANEIDIVKMMIKNDKVDVNCYEQKSGNTPLLIAIQKKNIEIAKLLIECERTNINLRNYSKNTALIFAVENNLVEIVDIIINNPKFDPIESRLNYAFYISKGAISKQLATLKVLNVNYKNKKNGKESSQSNKAGLCFSIKSETDLFETPLIYAVENKLFDKVELIVNHSSFDPNQSLIKKAIFKACQNDRYQIFNYLIKIINNDVNITKRSNRSLLQIAVKNGCDNIVRDIINNEKFDYDKSHFFDAFISCFENKESSFNMMTEMFNFDQAHKQLINFKDKNFPLSSCLNKLTSKDNQDSKFAEFVEFVVKNGADPNEPFVHDTYPLEYAIIFWKIDLVTALIDSDKIDFTKKLNRNALLANVQSKQESYSYSYLHVAVKNELILSMFLDKKLIDVNITDSNGETPLMKACRYTNNKSIDLLFTVDELDYKHRNNEGKDALEICIQLFKGTCNDPHETKENQRKERIISKSYSLQLFKINLK